MGKLILKIGFYLLLMLLILEVLVRISYLAKDSPVRYVDKYDVEKWVPNQHGYNVTGNRRQNFAEFNINNSGFNSYREFTPKENQIEIAIVGDSFIEGFHQYYNNSIGKKIENVLPNIEVYEYGYAGYDFADQIHLINRYKKDFDLIDHVIIYLDFNSDLNRGEYKIIEDRLALQAPLKNALKKCKLLVYSKSIGLLDIPKRFISKIIRLIKGNPNTYLKTNSTKDPLNETKYINNFKKLIDLYGFDKKRYSLLLDAKKTPINFLKYLKENNLKYIDFNTEFKTATKPTYLIYDQHWNNYGRNLIAKKITKSIKLNHD